jgi:energy-converting hydrogenase Eha subunit A
MYLLRLPSLEREKPMRFRDCLSAMLEFAGILGIGNLIYKWTDNYLVAIAAYLGLLILRLCLPS